MLIRQAHSWYGVMSSPAGLGLILNCVVTSPIHQSSYTNHGCVWVNVSQTQGSDSREDASGVDLGMQCVVARGRCSNSRLSTCGGHIPMLHLLVLHSPKRRTDLAGWQEVFQSIQCIRPSQRSPQIKAVCCHMFGSFGADIGGLYMQWFSFCGICSI